MDVVGDGGAILSEAPAAPAPAAPAPAPAQGGAQPAPPASNDPQKLFEASAAEPSLEPPPDAGPKIKFGDKELGLEEAQREYEATVNRLKGADKTTAAYRQRAQQAIDVANQYQQILRNAGMLSEDGNLVMKSPEEIRAAVEKREQPPPYEFKLPKALQVSEDAEARRAYFDHLENVANDKGLKYAFALILDRFDQTMQAFWEQFSGKEGYLERQFSERMAPMQPFFQNLETVNAHARFLQAMSQQTTEEGHQLYPELADREMVARLVPMMDELPAEWRHTPQGFAYAVKALRYQLWQESLQNPQEPVGEEASVPPSTPPKAPRPPVAVVLDKGAPSGVPRPKDRAAASQPDDGSRLLIKRGEAGGFRWT